MFIIIRRASTFYGRINLSDDQHHPVLLEDTDQLIFTVRDSMETDAAEVLIRKVITADREFEGNYGFELTPEETDLPVGTYYYDVGLQRENGEFYHITIPDQFIIKQSISRKDD